MDRHESASAPTAKWKYSFLYLTIIFSVLYAIHHQISIKLQLNNPNVYIKKHPDLPLRFKYDGTFKILQVADMHFGMGKVTSCRDVLASEFEFCSDLNTTLFLKRMIEAEKPDFIAFTGDNIFGSSTTDAAESMIKAFGPAVESRLPWAAILGNHDHESTMNREELMYFISLMDYSVARVNPSAEDLVKLAEGGEVKPINGFGNYDLSVHGPAGSYLANSSIFNLYFLDSGKREYIDGIRSYGWIKDSQLEWLRAVSKGLMQESGAQSPAVAFFHIPIPEIRRIYGQWIVGQMHEAAACSMVNSGVLETFVSMGDVKAVFMGHDHTNDFCGNIDGIWLCYGGGFGYHGYGKAGWPRRARVIVARLGKKGNKWTGVEKIRTWKRLDDEKLSKIDDQILWKAKR